MSFNNLKLGTSSLSGITTGDKNIVIGDNSGLSLTTESNNIYIGNNINPTPASNQFIIQNNGSTLLSGDFSSGALDFGSTALNTDTYMDIGEISQPAAPANGIGRLYALTDGTLHYRTDADDFDLTTVVSGTVTSLASGTPGTETSTSGLTFSTNPITSSGSVALSNTAVTPGTYEFATVTVDQRGRITAAANNNPVSFDPTTPDTESGSSNLTIVTEGASNSTLYTTSTTWDVPAGVTSINAVAVGGGGGAAGSGGGFSGGGGGGGGLAENQTLSVTPGETLTITRGAAGTAGGSGGGTGGNGGTSGLYRGGTPLVEASGGNGGLGSAGAGGAGGTKLTGANTGGTGGKGGNGSNNSGGGGGGGAAGYSGTGGAGGVANSGDGTDGTGGGGGGGSGWQGTGANNNPGGGVGLDGEGANGTGNTGDGPGGAGSGGSGQLYGGGGGAPEDDTTAPGLVGAIGAVNISYTSVIDKPLVAVALSAIADGSYTGVDITVDSSGLIIDVDNGSITDLTSVATSNIAVGNSTFASASGAEDNLGLGDNSIPFVTSGDRNVCLGASAGFNITTGTDNTYIGDGAGAGISTGSGNVMIGPGAGGTYGSGISNTLLITDGQDELIEGDFSTGELIFNDDQTTFMGSSRYKFTGVDNAATGPHIETYTSVDTYPLMQILPFGRDNVAINFDTYYNSGWKASHTTGSFGLIKIFDSFHTHYSAPTTAGSASNPTTSMILTKVGNVGLVLQDTTPDFNSGVGCVFMANATSVPTAAAPTGGGILYVSGGQLYYLGGDGTPKLVAS